MLWYPTQAKKQLEWGTQRLLTMKQSKKVTTSKRSQATCHGKSRQFRFKNSKTSREKSIKSPCHRLQSAHMATFLRFEKQVPRT